MATAPIQGFGPRGNKRIQRKQAGIPVPGKPEQVEGMPGIYVAQTTPTEPNGGVERLRKAIEDTAPSKRARLRLIKALERVTDRPDDK